MMFQGSRNLDLQPIAHLAHWVVAMLCNIWIYILGSPISDELLEYHHWLTFHVNKEWERSRKTRLAKLQKEMEKLQTTITHDEDYIARLGGMNFPNMLLTSICHQFYYCSRHDWILCFFKYSHYGLFYLISCLLFRAVFLGGYVSVKAKRQVWRQVKPCGSGSPPSKHAMKKRQCGGPLC